MSGPLSSEDRERLEELFEQAAELPAAEHAAFVERECGTNHQLRERLSRLLKGLVVEDRVGSHLSAGPLPSGLRIGRYELDQRIGEGGMGEVYAARQLEPVTRPVAVKVIKAGMDSAQVVRRFEAERQALARMAHPHVAQVFDGGVTEQGRPYFVMELVDGLPITDHCDQNERSTRERLELFLEVCAGVQHAHQKGIIHRDLKPSNLLVTSIDGRPIPKIIDFGVARATTGSLAGNTRHTLAGQVVGTLDYMSPEQADPAGQDVDTRSDVYSLGVVLYQLVSGLLPFDHGSATDRPLSEVQRAIREDDPPTPSLRLRRQTATATAVAPLRATDEQALIRQIEGDLDWICLKALEKDPSRRYQSVAELAEDVRRHLSDQPVRAGRPGMLHLAKKFVRRHRVAVTVSALLVLAVAAGVFGLFRSLMSARIERTFSALSELQKTEELVVRADELWPVSTDLVDELEEWRDEAEAMAANLPGYILSLEALRERALPRTPEEQRRDLESFPMAESLTVTRLLHDGVEQRLENENLGEKFRARQESLLARIELRIAELEEESRVRQTYRFESPDDQWQCTWMTQLVANLEALIDAETGLLSAQGNSTEHGWSVPRRLALAKDLQALEQSAGYEQAWEAARDAIRESPHYEGLDLGRQAGLLPLGADPQSGLWEFAHLSSGEPAARDPASGKLALTHETGIVLVLIPGGSFWMGSQNKDPKGPGYYAEPTSFESNANGDLHEVPDVRPFFLSKYEMTQSQWDRTAGTDPDDLFAGLNPNILLRPVDMVSWTGCDRTMQRLGLSLPTEEQWEYAARAGTTTPWSTGETEESLRPEEGTEHAAANLFDLSSDRRFPAQRIKAKTLPADWDDGSATMRDVGLGAPNDFGLHDVHGNATEWCSNRPYRYGTRPGSEASTWFLRTIRGGSSRGSTDAVRSAARMDSAPDVKAPTLGLRPSRALDR